MMTDSPILLIPAKPDPERDAVADAWTAWGWEVVRLDRFWEPPTLDASRVRIYGGTAFAHVVAQKLGLELIGPPDDLILRLDARWTQRALQLATVGDIGQIIYPIFAKPLVPKLFTAGVHQTPDTLGREVEGLKDDAQVIVSDVVHFESEYRCWCLNGEARTVARYEGAVVKPGPNEWVAELLQDLGEQGALVIDVGHIPGRGWAIVEFNGCWGAGLNGCSAEAVVDCIAAATRPVRPP